MSNPLKGCVPMNEFAAALEVTTEAVRKMQRTGAIKADRFQKAGRKLYVHKRDGFADLAATPLPTRGRLPRWLKTVGHKEGIAKLKAAEKAAAKAAKKAA
jgi:hypothetical protein